MGGCHRRGARNLSYVEALLTLSGHEGSGALFFLDGGSVEGGAMSDRELAARIDLEEDEGRPRVGSHAQFHALLRRQTNARLIVADPRDELATRYERLALCRNALLAEAHARLDDDGHLLTIDMDQEPLSPPTLVLATAAAMAPGGRLAPWAALTLSSTPWYRDTLALKTLGSLVPERAAAAGRQARRSVMHQAAGLGATSSLPLRQEGSPMGDPSGRPSLLCNCTVDPPRGVCLGCLEWRQQGGHEGGVACGEYTEDSCKRDRLGPIVTTGTYTSPPMAVDSAYNGLGIYAMRHLRGSGANAPSRCTYEGSITDAILCEHVSFHRCLRRRGLLIGIAPWLISEYPPSPCSPHAPPAACSRRRNPEGAPPPGIRGARGRGQRPGVGWRGCTRPMK